MTVDVDVVILGGGCAGLSLAVALAQRAPHLHVKILETREHYTRDRTWCFWNTEPHSFSAGVTHCWNSWRVRHNGVEARQQSHLYSYQHLPADAFYSIATTTLHNASHELCMGTNVRELRVHHDFCEVETDRGPLRSRWVFDSRPHASGLARPSLEQRFLGWHVRTERPSFDASVIDLMDFQPSAEHARTAFLYVLPFSSTEALVEATFLDPPSLNKPDAEALLREYLQRVSGDVYEVLYQESAVLPMGGATALALPPGHVRDIGARGGRIKASSGYAFLRIQRQSAVIADALAAEIDPPTSIEAPYYGALDRIFLRAMQLFPGHAPGYFLTLFQRLPPETVVRFLSETASPREILQVMLALPKLDFLQAALFPQPGRAA